MKRPSFHAARRRVVQAFSLPEVAIAVAIAALAIITIMGLLPAGLDSIRHASVLTSEARIMRQVVGYLEMSDWGQPNGNSWTQLNTLLGNRYYFDDEANPINTADPNAATISYVVMVQQAGMGGSGSGGGTGAHPLLPGASAVSSNAITLQINIAQSTNPNFDFGAATAVFATHPAILTKQFYTTTP